jgi:hypothetical protein
MSRMFNVVERHLEQQSDTPSVRLEFVGTKTAVLVGERGQGTVATLRNPSAVRPYTYGRFRAQWRAAAPQARSLVIERPYAGAPSVTPLRAPVAHLLEHLYLERVDQLIEHIERHR